tara:strand:+ start:193 stop:360 length:168 start_codon:yes stop_codon:yes gene_type:complete
MYVKWAGLKVRKDISQDVVKMIGKIDASLVRQIKAILAEVQNSYHITSTMVLFQK